MDINEVYRGISSSVIVEATAEGTMYNGCHNDIRLSIDYTNISEILHEVKHTAVVTTYVQEHRYTLYFGDKSRLWYA